MGEFINSAVPRRTPTLAPPSLVLYAFVAGVAALAIAGAVLAQGLLSGTAGPAERSSAAAPVHAPGAHAGAQGAGGHAAMETSFGTLNVAEVEKLGGLTAKDLAGMTHGVQSLVREGSMQVQVAMTLTNRSDRPVSYSPDQFRVRVGARGRPVAAHSSTIRSGSLPAGASIDMRLGFAVPNRGEKLRLTFRDPGGGAPIIHDLGRARAASGAGTRGALNFNPLKPLVQKDHDGH